MCRELRVGVQQPDDQALGTSHGKMRPAAARPGCHLTPAVVEGGYSVTRGPVRSRSEGEPQPPAPGAPALQSPLCLQRPLPPQ